jgi:HEAT repeat protein
MLWPFKTRAALNRTVVVTACVIWVCGAVGSMAERSSQVGLKEQVTRTIAEVRELSVPTIGISNARVEASERLAQLTKKINPNEIDEQTLADLVSLLETWDDAVREEVAASLGNLGPRAKVAAVPKLLEILPEVDCLWVDVSSEEAIQLALERMGETPPTPRLCERVVDPVAWKQWITDAIEKVRTSESSVAREKAAMLLDYLMFWLGPEQIDDGTVTALIALLDIPDQAVRDGVAEALGLLGRRARANAAPKLQELLVEVDCRAVTAGSAEVIRDALDRMRAKAPPANCTTD